MLLSSSKSDFTTYFFVGLPSSQYMITSQSKLAVQDIVLPRRYFVITELELSFNKTLGE